MGGAYWATVFRRPATWRSTTVGRLCLVAAALACPVHLAWVLALAGDPEASPLASFLWGALPLLVLGLGLLCGALVVVGVRLLNRRTPVEEDICYRPLA